MRAIIIISLLMFTNHLANAQVYTSKKGHIRFYSHTSIEDIEAHNYQVLSTLDILSGDIGFIVPVKEFEFKIALMQQHFNENYMESDKFPEARFTGRILNVKAVSFGKPGVYPVVVTGDLTIKGVTKSIRTSGTIEIKTGGIMAKAIFIVSPADFNIIIPRIMQNNIAREIEVNVEVNFDNA